MSIIHEWVEAEVLEIVEREGRYVGKKGCLLCLPRRNAAARLVEQGRLQYLGEFDGKQVWVKAEGEK